ncbi:ATP-binding protein [Kitasatospora sp. NPDC004799]|uniref:ATP-binding protein n=1 Tax=Kitasatospora sp. NPDC004799 TaxID=3154460 RepID=UPI0033AF66B8
MIVSPLKTARFPVPLEWGVPSDGAAVPAARRLVMDIVRFWVVPLSEEALRELELCASEVIANAMEHAKARCTVTVRRVAQRLRVEVADPDPAFERGQAQPGATSGRGLILVEGLAHAWGWHPVEGEGKVVWFEFLDSDEAPCPTYGWGTAGTLWCAGFACAPAPSVRDLTEAGPVSWA